MDVSLAEDAMVPHALKHRFQISVSKLEGKPSSGNDPDPKPQPPQTQSFIGAPLEVGKPAVTFPILRLLLTLGRRRPLPE
jgi:hypothetical protein